MQKLLFILLIALSSSPCPAQWRHIHDFIDSSSGLSEGITNITFLDHPGPPRVGFVGTEPELWKTTDGGNSWTKCWAYDAPDYAGADVQDIVFKDSMTGWFLYSNCTVYKTTNGGDSWNEVSPLPIPPEYGANDIHYCAASNRLLVSGLFTDSMAVSTDLGNTWATTNVGQYGFFAFSNDSVGVLSVISYPDTTTKKEDTISGILRTTDAGITWSLANTPFSCWLPLAIPGTPTCFANGSVGLYQTNVYRSDDYGKTWRELYSFPFSYDTSTFTEIAPFETGSMYGDLSRLYIPSDSGIFVSTDEGITWNLSNVRQPDGPVCLFHGKAFSGMTSYATGIRASGGLWEEDTGVAAGVPEPEPFPATLSVFPNPASSILQIIGEQAGEVHLFDLMGRERMSALTDGATTTLDVSSLEPGMYFLREGNESAKVEINR